MRFLEGVLTSFSTLLTLSSFTSVLAHDGCMDLEEVTEISHCMEIETWEEFVSIVDDSVPGDELFFCPFDIDKGDEDPVTIEWGLKIICVFDSNTDRCNFRGYGQFLIVATGGDTLIQGLTFRDGDDYAVHVTSGGQNALEASHTFCYCRFTKISVLDVNSRGGAFMTEFGAGTVNILYCYFGSNFSMTRGAAVYARAKQVNIVGTIFADNSSLEWGAAIYAAADANIYVEGSTFIRNKGKDDFATAVAPTIGSGTWEDGGDNLSEDGPCDGFYVIVDNRCDAYNGAKVTSTTSFAPSQAPTSSVDSICSYEVDEEPCIEVESFAHLKAAIMQISKVTFCGGFNFEKASDDFIELANDREIRCASSCTIYGGGTHIKILGDYKVRIHNMKFMFADSSAIMIDASSENATTTLCGIEFLENMSEYGGAIYVGTESGFVNIVRSNFTNNVAEKGGAIYGSPFTMNIIESRFVDNEAIQEGSAIFAMTGSQVVLRSTYFEQNLVDHNVTESKNYDVVVEASLGANFSSAVEEAYVDGGDNVVAYSGDCSGFYVQSMQSCFPFGMNISIFTDFTYSADGMVTSDVFE